MDFAAFPPEVNSTLMYSGAGSGPILAAATAWEALAGELESTALLYDTLITSLTDGPWQGNSAAAMVAAVMPQVTWLRSTAGLAGQAGSQAVAAASAFEAAFVATVPPAEVAANRALLAALLATNVIGQNTAAIAATEAQYAEMWAQDAAAMYGYSGASAQATQLTPFNPTTAGSSIEGLYSQFSATLNATLTSANAQGLFDVPKALMTMAGLTNEAPWLTDPMKALGLTGHTWNATGDGIVLSGALGDVAEGLTGSQTLDSSIFADMFGRWVSPARLMVTQFKDYVGLFEQFGKMVPQAAKAGAEGAAAAAAALPGAAKAGLGGIAGALGGAVKAGALSVPAAWAATGPAAAAPVNVALAGLSSGAAAEGATTAFGGMPMVPGGGAARTVANFAAPRYGFKPTVIAAPPSGG